MFILHNPQEAVEVLVEGVVNPMNAFVSFLDESFSGGNVAHLGGSTIQRGQNRHLEVPADTLTPLCEGPTTRGAHRSILNVVLHNKCTLPATVSLYLRNSAAPLRFLMRVLAPDQALVYGNGGWELVPDIALLQLPGVVQPFGALRVGHQAGARFLAPGYTNGLADATPIGIVSPRGGTMTAMYARHNKANGNGNPVEYRLRKNGFDTSLATGVIINGFDTNEAHHVTIAAGDLLEVTASKAASIGANEAASEVQAMVSLLLRA